MDAPKCRNIPSCGKRHYGDCDTLQEPRPKKEKPVRKARGGEYSGVAPRSTDGRKIVENPVPDWQRIDELLAKVESLEARVLELESRKKYMRDYQRKKRAEDKADG